MSNNILVRDVKKDDLKQFLNDMVSTLEIIKQTDGLDIDLNWITRIKEATPYINNIFDNPKSFIVNQEELLNIEKTKKVTIESIKHLSKHSNFIEEYDADKNSIKPTKLLNVLKEETYDIYENRFIYTLVDFLESFVYRMEKKIKNINLQSNNQFNYNGKTNLDNDYITYNFTMKSSKKISFKDDTVDFKNDIEKIKSSISNWKQSIIYTELSKQKVAKVINPIKRTNVILKNPNFKIAVKLWDYIYSYNEKIDNMNKLPTRFTDLPLKYEKHIKNSFAITYFIMKAMNASTDLQKIKYENNIKSLNMQLFKDITSSIVESDDAITKEDLLSIVSDKFDEVKKVEGFDYSTVENKIKSAVKSFIDKVNDSYFEVESVVEDEKNNKNNI